MTCDNPLSIVDSAGRKISLKYDSNTLTVDSDGQLSVHYCDKVPSSLTCDTLDVINTATVGSLVSQNGANVAGKLSVAAEFEVGAAQFKADSTGIEIGGEQTFTTQNLTSNSDGLTLANVHEFAVVPRPTQQNDMFSAGETTPYFNVDSTGTTVSESFTAPCLTAN